MAVDPALSARPIVSDDPAHVAIRLRATVSHLTRQLRGLAAADGPGAAKLGVLGQLYRQGALSPSQLARHERVRLQTLTRLIAELEAAGLVSRSPHPSDARQSLLALTADGVRVLTDDVQRREASLARAIAETLSGDERERLLTACALVDRLADAIPDADDAP